MTGVVDQLELALPPPKARHGGKREGAGRKKSGTRRDAEHRPRAKVTKHTPVHTVLRVVKSVGRLRRGPIFAAIRRAIREGGDGETFRVVHVSIQHNHLHFLVEATDTQAMSAGMQRLAILAARTINATLERRGKVFAYRFHSTVITSPRQARSALAYVLNNWRHHREDLAAGAMLDKFSSAVSFPGWNVTWETLPAGYVPVAVAEPRTWLLRVGWQKHGATLDAYAIPGPP